MNILGEKGRIMHVFEEPWLNFFLLSCIVINKMKQQITENKEKYFFGKKIPSVGSDLKKPYLHMYCNYFLIELRLRSPSQQYLSYIGERKREEEWI